MSARFVDLTLPLYDFMPVGNVWAWDVPFQTRPITRHEQHGYELFMITMHSETGTRLMTRAMTHTDAPRIDELPLQDFVLRPATIVKAPCGADGELTPGDIDRALARANPQAGDAILVHTGWGDNQRWNELGDDYARRTPCFSREAAARLVEAMRALDSNLTGSDVAYWGRGDRYMRPEWAALPGSQRNPFPSIQAQRYLASYTREKALEDWQSPAVLTAANVHFVGALCNLDQLSQARLQVIVLPLKIRGARGAPCRVVAVEV